MRFDTIIIGGGLSGLTAATALAGKGQKCLVIAAGQSALHFFSGSFEMLSQSNNPAEAIGSLPPEHPFAKLGSQRVMSLAQTVQPMFANMGINMQGSTPGNHLRITPFGLLKPAWLTLSEMLAVPANGTLPWQNVAVVGIEGFLDFNPHLVAHNLTSHGINATALTVGTPQLSRLRSNPSEMRSTNIARALTGDALQAFIEALGNAQASSNVQAILLPAVLGLNDSQPIDMLRQALSVPVHTIATMPPSVPGIRLQSTLQRQFLSLGGTIMNGDTVVSGNFKDNRLHGVFTANHGSREFTADNFVLATGSFMSHGLSSDRNGVYESALGLDVDYLEQRSQWVQPQFFAPQPFMSFGVATNANLNPLRNGTAVANIYAAGSVLSNCNAPAQGCETGVKLISALHAASQITK
ncbi:MAG: glycerol-3-phosphate dehydrogenase subunit GlpB [Muribaculaceae bacterium]